ncbi:putative secreted protein with PEP-CTERM sorting signal [Nitrosospira sp. Nsp2]|uniref:HAF repeat-containing PEP-CTERM protein n=1 Tax=Nitrosospira sp. Nsp2 TaxID=136548 RepID=UPI000D3068E7|nr:HAF repeat-containing PEP-CTERM protein [Nitrosospira sp. Nsp2]PTR16033.1 putative secreted protein with PEP-CTERM sorting signal [Nitrosospira sp. Nsp2]
MSLNRCFKVSNLILSVALIIGLGHGTHAVAQERFPFLIDLNTRTVTQLERLDGGTTVPRALNDVGRVVGYYFPPGQGLHGFITGPDGMGMRNLGLAGSSVADDAADINEAGQVVGRRSTPTPSSTTAFITGPNGEGIRDLGSLGGDFSAAQGINDAGQVVGESETAERDSHAYITGPNGTGMRDIGALEGNFSSASRINDAGQVVGHSTTAEQYFHGFITGADGMGMRDLGTLGGRNSYANDINAAGRVVGSSDTAAEGHHAFITAPDGVGMMDLGALGGGISWASGINDAGQVAGTTSTAEGGEHAFITGPNGEGMTDLNSLVDLPPGVLLMNAVDINNSGQVIATGVPEPETYALLLVGLGLIGFMARPKRLPYKKADIKGPEC